MPNVLQNFSKKKNFEISRKIVFQKMNVLSNLTEPVVSFATGLLFGYAIWARKGIKDETEYDKEDDSDWEVLIHV